MNSNFFLEDTCALTLFFARRHLTCAEENLYNPLPCFCLADLLCERKIRRVSSFLYQIIGIKGEGINASKMLKIRVQKLCRFEEQSEHFWKRSVIEMLPRLYISHEIGMLTDRHGTK